MLVRCMKGGGGEGGITKLHWGHGMLVRCMKEMGGGYRHVALRGKRV